jgi:hypothetical protein
MADAKGWFDVGAAAAGQIGWTVSALVVGALAWLFRKPIAEQLIPKLSSVKAGGIELAFETRMAIDAAVELAEKHPDWQVDVPASARERVIRRAERSLDLCKGARILWIDDRPANNRNERRMLRQLGIDVEPVTTTELALTALAPDQGGYDVIISDMHRVEDGVAHPEAGKELLARYTGHVPVILYVGVFDPRRGVPGPAFGITNRPDELLHLVIDALERVRG